MGAEDMKRQALNVLRMRSMGAKVIPVLSGSRTLKDAVNEAMRDWVTNVRTTFYCLGSVVGPHPYPWMVREFQSVIGREAAPTPGRRRPRPRRPRGLRGRRVQRHRPFRPVLRLARRLSFLGVEAGATGFAHRPPFGHVVHGFGPGCCTARART
jgi:hypothetical protein